MLKEGSGGGDPKSGDHFSRRKWRGRVHGQGKAGLLVGLVCCVSGGGRGTNVWDSGIGPDRVGCGMPVQGSGI